ncbi:MAG: aspartate ammonia-lyase [Candidatus Mcinerneyibacterium aminivorans]|uniref:Aspartate ammonia-lyase n=1 Tax=Candidatus Mcinerneyibacterium aminivorans TaxID=2703815 RepID=A0A5D0MKI9_9BACT|nr:MAG: aspartate ammonia-lyase [Candidatus Mcinerneyibacterium aminivorans]
MKFREEKDYLGKVKIQKDKYYGIHTKRALKNFPISDYKIDSTFIKSFAYIKHAAALTNKEYGYLDSKLADSIVQACTEIENGKFHEQIVVDPFQGGAGTSTNMNFNEVIANRANEILGYEKGSYSAVDPLDHVNKHQSTNDVFPSALQVAVLFGLHDLEKEIMKLQDSLQKKEQTFRHILKIGRTQLQDAVPVTLGMEFGAWANAVSRDRWRIFKSRERIKPLNLGGTAVGTGLGAPKKYIFKVVENLKDLTGLTIARAENLIDATQNKDSLVEVSGMLKAYGSNLLKITSDLRLLSSGPKAGINEISLPRVQKGSSIMPTKINPVILESVSQIALKVINNDNLVGQIAGLGNLEINQFLPLMMHTLMETLKILISGTNILREKCIKGIEANEKVAKEYALNSKTIATIFVPKLGYEKVEHIIKKSIEENKTIKNVILEEELMEEDEIDEMLSPWNMYKLGFDD